MQVAASRGSLSTSVTSLQGRTCISRDRIISWNLLLPSIACHDDIDVTLLQSTAQCEAQGHPRWMGHRQCQPSDDEAVWIQRFSCLWNVAIAVCGGRGGRCEDTVGEGSVLLRLLVTGELPSRECGVLSRTGSQCTLNNHGLTTHCTVLRLLVSECPI